MAARPPSSSGAIVTILIVPRPASMSRSMLAGSGVPQQALGVRAPVVRAEPRSLQVDPGQHALLHQCRRRPHRALKVREGGGDEAGHERGGPVLTVHCGDLDCRGSGMSVIEAEAAAAVDMGVDEPGRQRPVGIAGVRLPGEEPRRPRH